MYSIVFDTSSVVKLSVTQSSGPRTGVGHWDIVERPLAWLSCGEIGCFLVLVSFEMVPECGNIIACQSPKQKDKSLLVPKNNFF